MDQKTAGKPMPRPSLEQMLATVPSHSQRILDEKVNDTHLAEISRALIDWKSVCTMLGISEADEAAIKEENETTDARRYGDHSFNKIPIGHLYRIACLCFVCSTNSTSIYCGLVWPHRLLTRPLGLGNALTFLEFMQKKCA